MDYDCHRVCTQTLILYSAMVNIGQSRDWRPRPAVRKQPPVTDSRSASFVTSPSSAMVKQIFTCVRKPISRTEASWPRKARILRSAFGDFGGRLPRPVWPRWMCRVHFHSCVARTKANKSSERQSAPMGLTSSATRTFSDRTADILQDYWVGQEGGDDDKLTADAPIP
jgi:hypothetical protein